MLLTLAAVPFVLLIECLQLFELSKTVSQLCWVFCGPGLIRLFIFRETYRGREEIEKRLVDILMPHNLNLKLFALRSKVVAEACVVSLRGGFAHQFVNRNSITVGNRATSTPALTTVDTRIIITANIFKYQTVGHLVKLERLWILTHQLIVCDVFEAELESLLLA